jgi:CBS domain-containing protein
VVKAGLYGSISKDGGETFENLGSMHPDIHDMVFDIDNSDIMYVGEEIPILKKGCKMSEAIIKISEKGFGCIGITSDDKLIGIITDGDLRRHMGPEMLEKNVEEIMTKDPYAFLNHRQ